MKTRRNYRLLFKSPERAGWFTANARSREEAIAILRRIYPGANLATQQPAQP